MNKDRARTILLGIGDGATGIQREDAISAVIDELTETPRVEIKVENPGPDAVTLADLTSKYPGRIT